MVQLEKEIQYKYKIGDSIKLIDYSAYPDYKEHKNQIGYIDNIYTDGLSKEQAYHLRWRDKTSSCVYEPNMSLVNEDWDE